MFTTVETKLARIAQMSKERPKEAFTSVYHLIDEELLMICHKELKANKASGIDGVTKADYEVNLKENIRNLTSKVQSMKYIPASTRRVYIPKINGRMRGLAIIYEKLATEKTKMISFRKIC